MTSDRRDEIMRLAAELFATKGIAPTTVRDIGERAGVFSGSLYHFFRSKNAIVAEILSGFMADIDQRFRRVVETSTSARETVRGLIRQTLAVIEEHPHPTAIYQQNRQYLRDNGLLDVVDAPSRTVRDYWLTALAAGVADGSFRSDIPAEVFYRTVRDTLWASMHWPGRDDYTTDEFTDLLVALFFGGFADEK